MADDTHDVRLPSIRIDGIAHGLAVNRQTLVGLPVIGVPALERTVERGGIHPDEQIKVAPRVKTELIRV